MLGVDVRVWVCMTSWLNGRNGKRDVYKHARAVSYGVWGVGF